MAAASVTGAPPQQATGAALQHEAAMPQHGVGADVAQHWVAP
jgi:hypothetical protein